MKCTYHSFEVQMNLYSYIACSGNLYVIVCAIINSDRIMSLFSQG